MSGFFSGIQNAERINRLPPLIEGTYPAVQVLKCTAFTGAPQNGSRQMFKAWLLVVESAPGLSPVGTVTAYMQQMNTKNPAAAQAAVAELIAACLGINPLDTARRKAEVTEQVANSVVLPANPLGGSILGLHVRNQPPRADGAVFQDWTWTPILDQATGRPMFRPVPPQYVNVGSERDQGPQASAPGAGQAPAATLPGGAGAYNPGAFGHGGMYQATQGLPIPGAMVAGNSYAGAQAPGGFTPAGPAAPLPAAYGVPQGAPPAPAFPPPGWLALPNGGGFYKPGMAQAIPEAQLRQLMAAGQV